MNFEAFIFILSDKDLNTEELKIMSEYDKSTKYISTNDEVQINEKLMIYDQDLTLFMIVQYIYILHVVRNKWFSR